MDEPGIKSLLKLKIMKKHFLIICCMLTLFQCVAQKEATTIDGKKVILNDDRTWKYLEIIAGSNGVENINCNDFISTKTDKVTGETSVAAKNRIIISKDGGRTGLGLILINSKGDLIFSLQATGAGNCIKDTDKINILFRDETRLELTNETDFNCDGKFTVYFGGLFGKIDELRLLKTKEIETIRAWTSNGFVEEDLTPLQSKKIMRTIECLMK